MYTFLYFFIFLLLLITPYTQYIHASLTLPILKLNTTNLILLKGSINKETTNKFLQDLHSLENKQSAFVFIDTNGGSVEDGNKIIREVQKNNMSCIVEKAYSMGFAILQSCNRRLMLPYGKIMQHQISFGIQSEKAKIESYMDFINQMEHDLVDMQATKIGITNEEFKNKTYNDWWLFGNYAVIENCADEIINVECTQKLVKEKHVISSKSYDTIYSKCPLIPDPIEKKEKKKMSLEDLFADLF
jgi:ATP-dependent protease ClpP protease subunit